MLNPILLPGLVVAVLVMSLAARFDRRGENVVVVDISEANCKKCMELGIRTVRGDAVDVNVLRKAGIENAYVVATTNKDDTNLLFCQIAKASFGFRENSWWQG